MNLVYMGRKFSMAPLASSSLLIWAAVFFLLGSHHGLVQQMGSFAAGCHQFIVILLQYGDVFFFGQQAFLALQGLFCRGACRAPASPPGWRPPAPWPLFMGCSILRLVFRILPAGCILPARTAWKKAAAAQSRVNSLLCLMVPVPSWVKKLCKIHKYYYSRMKEGLQDSYKFNNFAMTELNSGPKDLA